MSTKDDDDVIPMQRLRSDGKLEAFDYRTGRVLAVQERPLLPSGQAMEVLQAYKARLLRPIDGRRKGSVHGVELMPFGALFLVDGALCFCAEAEEGRDFVFVTDAAGREVKL